MTQVEQAESTPLDHAKDPVQADGRERLTVVGIGASAGGLAALQGFFGALPSNSGMAYVVVTHMDPERESLLPELLQRETAMPVHQVTGLVPIEANNVYVISPNRRIQITDTHLDSAPFDQPRGQRTPIDFFFRTLAGAHRDAVAIILSGGGTDGSVGVKSVKEHGGLLLVQHPDEAEHDSMPRAAINTGLADMVLPVAELAEKLVAYRRNGVSVPLEPEQLTPEELDLVYRILTQVQVHTGHDFSQYKRSTILRRIQRRMQLNEQQTLDAYLTNLRHDAAEGHALFNDLLIGVTNFFRDRDAWNALNEKVIPRLFAGKKQDDTVRAWSIGCATGEEAYSLAILLLEHRERMQVPLPARPALQVFASDLDDEALNKAREGIYPEAIEADVSTERLEQFFVKDGHHYRVRQELRDVVLFSSHSVLRDPPFSRLDLISCRNLLIYLERELQQNVFQIFHYALKPEAFLFLGTSESAETGHDLFRTLDKTYRIFQARPWRSDHPQVPTLPLTVTPSRYRERARRRQSYRPAAHEVELPGAAAGFHAQMLEASAPPSAVVDESYHVLHLSESAGRFLQLPGGTVTNDLLKLVRPELRLELRTALFHALEENKSVVSTPVYVPLEGSMRRVTLAARPHVARDTDGDAGGEDGSDTVQAEDGEQLALVFFLEDEVRAEVAEARGTRQDAAAPGAEAGRAAERELLLQLEAEVHRLRERLQDTTEEYESSNEELKAANEELQSINEEYRSTTEELETSKEELQSVNEELQTVNNELKNKLEEVSRAHSDMENLMAATGIATLFLDRELRIQRYTPVTAEFFNIIPGDRGRPIDHLTNKLEYDALPEDAARVLRTLVPAKREVRDLEGRWLLAHLRPYRTVDDRIDGVVATFVDISDVKQVEEKLRERDRELVSLAESLEAQVEERTEALEQARHYSEVIVATVREGLVVLQPDLTVEFANESFYSMFNTNPEETEGELIYNLGNGQWDIPELRRLLEEILPEESVFNDYRVAHEFEGIGSREMLLNARRLDHQERILLAIEDVTRQG